MPNDVKNNDEKWLAKKFIQFLKEDKSINFELSVNNGGRRKRAAPSTVNPMSLEAIDLNPPTQENPGFFDRAAKFVVELLQRFLRWINTDNN